MNPAYLLTDVCNSQGIRGYPSLFLYVDGKKVEEYSEWFG